MGTIVKVSVSIEFRDSSCTLRIHGHLISDINECSEGSHRCEQECHNAIGSYACSCEIGYRLNHDKLTCTGNFCVIAKYASQSILHLIVV